MTADAPETPLWEFSLRVYSQPGIEGVCLRLQDEHGADIPLLLAALWSAVEGPGVLTRDELDALDALVAPWREQVVRPLRQTRRWMKGAGYDPDPLREQVKVAELLAERRELALIADWLAGRPPRDRPAPTAETVIGALGDRIGGGAADVATLFAPLTAAAYRRSV